MRSSDHIPSTDDLRCRRRSALLLRPTRNGLRDRPGLGILNCKDMTWRDHIERNPEIMLGKPVIKGTRITVELVLERLGDGWSDSDLCGSYPQLEPAHIRAAQAYAASAISSDEIRFLDETG